MSVNEEVKGAELSYTLEEVTEKFCQLGLRWNIDSVMYIESQNKTLNTVREFTVKHLLILVASGLKEHDIKKATEILDNWIEEGYGLLLLHTLIIERMTVRHFFMDTSEMEVLTEFGEKAQARDVIYKSIAEQLIAVTRQSQVKA